VRFFDGASQLLAESGACEPTTGVLSHDEQLKIYDVEPGLDLTTAPLVGEPEGPSFHFLLNNKIYKDNRIPPCGFTNAAYADFGGAPVEYSYADGQYWDDTFYAIPAGTVSAEVTLYYQSTSKKFVEFLRDENSTNDKGQEIFDLWNNNGKCPPEQMAATNVALTGPVLGDLDGDGDVDLDDFALLVTPMNGPNQPPGNAQGDLDGDNDCDLDDYAIFAANFTGSL